MKIPLRVVIVAIDELQNYRRQLSDEYETVTEELERFRDQDKRNLFELYMKDQQKLKHHIKDLNDLIELIMKSEEDA